MVRNTFISSQRKRSQRKTKDHTPLIRNSALQKAMYIFKVLKEKNKQTCECRLLYPEKIILQNRRQNKKCFQTYKSQGNMLPAGLQVKKCKRNSFRWKEDDAR